MIGTSLASMASMATLDPIWMIEPAFGVNLWISLSRTDSAVANVTNAAAVGPTGPRGQSAEKADQETPDIYGIADYRGVHQGRRGVNSDGSSKPYPVDGGIALLAINGVMTKDAPDWWSSGGSTSTVLARKIVRQAASDADIKGVLIRFCSPGGQVSGNDDLAADIKRLADTKLTFGFAEDLCASAAYYCASQCNAIYANRSARIGSISTVLSIQDISKMAAEMGVTVHVVTPDEATFKGLGTPGTPVTDAHLDYLKDLVTTYAAQFHSTVKAGRGLTDEQMKQVTDGRTFIATKARSLGLIDGITTYDNVLAKMKSIKR